jgi:hypothetical protein
MDNEDMVRAVRRRFVVSLTLSLLIVLIGMGWTWQVGQQSNRLYHEGHHAHEALNELERSLPQTGGGAR